MNKTTQKLEIQIGQADVTSVTADVAGMGNNPGFFRCKLFQNGYNITGPAAYDKPVNITISYGKNTKYYTLDAPGYTEIFQKEYAYEYYAGGTEQITEHHSHYNTIYITWDGKNLRPQTGTYGGWSGWTLSGLDNSQNIKLKFIHENIEEEWEKIENPDSGWEAVED
ncbi:MAG TPA: hypothetical protein VEK38_02135, partial [Candidatus Bathyarchaeia archaeon]|nr:hypothetical protein [Candidatus Bathyarchaeia archaeon]